MSTKKGRRIVDEMNRYRKKPKRKGPPQPVTAPKTFVEFDEVRALARKTKYASDESRCQRDRIIDALHWMMNHLPGGYVQMNVLYWLVFGGKSLKRMSNPEIKVRFTKAVQRTRYPLAEAYGPCYLHAERGSVCPLRNAEKIAEFAGEKTIRDAMSGAKRWDYFQSATGDPAKWKITDENRTILESVRKSMTHLQRMLNSAKHLQLPAAEPSQADAV